MNFISTFLNSYHELFYERADPRIRDKFLMGNPAPIFTIYAAYAIFFQFIMPRIMKDRDPVDVRKYDYAIHVVLLFNSTFFTIWAVKYWIHLDWRCQSLYTGNATLDSVGVNACWIYMLSKFFYTFESLTAALRKNLALTEAYLLIHHATLPLAIWSIINYYPGGHAMFIGFANSFFHMLLYGYRVIFLHIFRSMFLNTRLYKKRKAFAAVIFVSQFVVIFLHTIQLFFWNYCDFPMGYAYLTTFYVTIITVLLLVWIVPQL